MGVANWLKIIGQILIWIAEGLSKDDAISKASAKFGVSASEIRKRM